MKNMRFSLSSVLLAVLVVPVIMTYQINPGDTNYIQFGLIFLGLFLTFILDILPITQKKYYLFKYLLFFFVLALSVGGAFLSAVVVRHKVAPVFQIHDIILQLEAAIRFFIDGVNPWAATYHNTFMAAWHFSDTLENPALYHFVMMPFYLLFSLPFYVLSNHTIGYFDGRIPLYFLYFSLIPMVFNLVKEREQKLIFTILLLLNPAMFLYTLEGRSDVFMYAFLFAGLMFLGVKRFIYAGIAIALAFTVKQSVWPILPLYIGYLYFVSKDLKQALIRFAPFVGVFLALTIPFFLWNPSAFLNSTVFYLSGNTEHSYPISGYGLGMLLHQLGFIKNLADSYPFIIWQVIIIVPLLIGLLIFLRKNPSVKMVIFTYGILLFAYWYLSRYFNNSHVAYLTMVFLTAYFWPSAPIEGRHSSKRQGETDEK